MSVRRSLPAYVRLRAEITSSDKSFCVRTLSTGEPHPAVSHEGKVFPPDDWKTHPGSSRVCGTHVAVASDQGLYIFAWDWKSGVQVSEFVSRVFRFLLTLIDQLALLASHCTTTLFWVSRREPYCVCRCQRRSTLCLQYPGLPSISHKALCARAGALLPGHIPAIQSRRAPEAYLLQV